MDISSLVSATTEEDSVDPEYRQKLFQQEQAQALEAPVAPSVTSEPLIRRKEENVTTNENLPQNETNPANTKTCPCGNVASDLIRPPIPCVKCNRQFHIGCIKSASSLDVLLGDDLFSFSCSSCSEKGQEIFQRFSLVWVDVVHIALYHFTHSHESKYETLPDNRRYVNWKHELCALIDDRWDYFWKKKPRSGNFQNSIASALSANSIASDPILRRFESAKAHFDKPGYWALTSPERLPSSYDIAKNRLTENDATKSVRRKRRADSNQGKISKRQKKRERAKPEIPTELSKDVKKKTKSSITMYPDIENPTDAIRFCRQPTHTAPQFQQSSDGLTVWNSKGYRLTKATHGVEEGAWYFEVRVLEEGGHLSKTNKANLRIGWAQISADLQGPCGMDPFSYGYRMDAGTVFNESRGTRYGSGYGPGDVLGCLIHLPPLTPEQRKDLDSRQWVPGSPYVPFYRERLPPLRRRPSSSDNVNTRAMKRPFSAISKDKDTEQGPPLRTVQGSQIAFFKNGVCEGVGFHDLFVGKYHPAVSSYMGGKVIGNFGPRFDYPPPETWSLGDANGSTVPVRPMSALEETRMDQSEAETPMYGSEEEEDEEEGDEDEDEERDEGGRGEKVLEDEKEEEGEIPAKPSDPAVSGHEEEEEEEGEIPENVSNSVVSSVSIQTRQPEALDPPIIPLSSSSSNSAVTEGTKPASDPISSVPENVEARMLEL